MQIDKINIALRQSIIDKHPSDAVRILQTFMETLGYTQLAKTLGFWNENFFTTIQPISHAESNQSALASQA